MLEVAEHYYHFGGVSPINAQNQALIAALEDELAAHGPRLAVYWGNRNWHPLLADALRRMAGDGARRALAFVTSPYSSYSTCREYLEAIETARRAVGPRAPVVHKLRAYFNHPGFVDPMIERVRAALEEVPAEERASAPILFTAHSIPRAMADNCAYVAQLHEVSRLVSDALGRGNWRLVYQSRRGRPSRPWLEPDVCQTVKEIAERRRAEHVVIAPIGFVSDHMEVVFDLDVEARQVCESAGLKMVRAGTVGSHPRFVQMVRELIVERLSDAPARLSLGGLGPSHDVCPSDCCRYTP
jgi:ferrochelatase